MSEQDPDKLADELEREATHMERQSGELHEQVKETRQDWQRKRHDEGVPGAPPPDGDDEG